MTEDNLMLEVLTSIRDEIRTTNVKLDATRTELSERLDATRTELSERLDGTNTRITQMDVRLSTEIHEINAGIRDAITTFRTRRALETRVERVETEIEALKRRLP